MNSRIPKSVINQNVSVADQIHEMDIALLAADDFEQSTFGSWLDGQLSHLEADYSAFVTADSIRRSSRRSK